jgi:hypothetical protein
VICASSKTRVLFAPESIKTKLPKKNLHSVDSQHTRSKWAMSVRQVPFPGDETRKCLDDSNLPSSSDFMNYTPTRFQRHEGTEYFVSLQTSGVITGQCNVMVNSEELIGTIEYITL